MVVTDFNHRENLMPITESSIKLARDWPYGGVNVTVLQGSRKSGYMTQVQIPDLIHMPAYSLIDLFVLSLRRT